MTSMLAAIRSLLYDLRHSVRRSSTVRSHAAAQSSHLVVSLPVGTTSGDPSVARSLPLPLLTHLEQLDAADWLEKSLTTFARNVASSLPGHFPAYARVYHPFHLSGRQSGLTSWWRDLPEVAGLVIDDPATAEHIATFGSNNGQAYPGSPTLQIIEALIDHLGVATTTPDECYFAVWEGFGGSVVPGDLNPRLKLPARAYHVFTGPMAAARTSYDAYSFGYADQFANLWWPADHAWCVSTDVDSAWTHVGGSRECINAVLADPRLETVETSAESRW